MANKTFSDLLGAIESGWSMTPNMRRLRRPMSAFRAGHQAMYDAGL